MIKAVITNEMLNSISIIEENRFYVANVELPSIEMNRLRKNSKKKSTYASNKIEGNVLTEKQVDEVIESDAHKHFLKPEQEVRNYFLALSYLEDKLKKKEKVTKKFILEVQAIVEKGASKEKIGLRGAMPPGVLFAVYDAQSGKADYIPPEYSEIPELLDELVDYINHTDDHPLIIAATAHYQLVTIHPFEDGNGRTARLISGYLLDYYGYGFRGIGSLVEYFAYDTNEYYESLQMGLPPLYYQGRENPPHSEIWYSYFLRMMELYSKKVYELSNQVKRNNVSANLTHLNIKERDFLLYILKNNFREFTPIELAKKMNVTNRTIINRTTNLVNNGFIVPVLVNKRIRSYALSEYTKKNKNDIIENLK